MGEDSRPLFKRLLANEKQPVEMAVFANAGGGRIVIGVADDGTIPGLTPEEVRRQNAILSTAAAQQVRNPLSPLTEFVRVGGNTVIHMLG